MNTFIGCNRFKFVMADLIVHGSTCLEHLWKIEVTYFLIQPTLRSILLRPLRLGKIFPRFSWLVVRPIRHSAPCEENKIIADLIWKSQTLYSICKRLGTSRHPPPPSPSHKLSDFKKICNLVSIDVKYYVKLMDIFTLPQNFRRPSPPFKHALYVIYGYCIVWKNKHFEDSYLHALLIMAAKVRYR